MELTGQVIQLTLTDLLFITAIACMIIVTIALVRALRSLNSFLGKSEKLAEEVINVAKDVQAKSKAVDELTAQICEGGNKFLKLVLDRKKPS